VATSPKDSVAASPGTLVSLVVGDAWTPAELEKLFGKSRPSRPQNFEVIVVDQNSDDRLGYLFSREWPFRLRRFIRPAFAAYVAGATRDGEPAKVSWLSFRTTTAGIRHGSCRAGIELMSSSKADILTGRAANEADTTSTADIPRFPRAINRSNVWTSGIEWMMLFRKSALLAGDGFDETIASARLRRGKPAKPRTSFCGAGPQPAVHVRSLIFTASQGIRYFNAVKRQSLRPRSRLRASHP